ncbi:MAG: GvpL/GvpF family gas vesicle protein [Thaumarchaeota archaeon]|nr:GvpL/GvpF family gas vesicle protein [Nitrososphaerota archaeon]
MVDGKYVYCIVDFDQPAKLGSEGLFGNPTRVVVHKDIGAVVSPIVYAEMQPNIDSIISHQRVVEASRKLGTTLPVKFGVIFKTDEGVKALLVKQYANYRDKLTKLEGRDEFGVKVLFNKAGMEKIRSAIEETSPEIVKMRRSLEKTKEGRSYFTKLKISEAIKNEAYRKLDELSRNVHDDLVRNSERSSILKSEHQQIILNGAYLVMSGDGPEFLARAARLGKAYAEKGLIVHSSGPWAPYSFC